MAADGYGDQLARSVSQRIGPSVTNEAALSSVPASQKVNGRVFLAKAENSLWRWNSTTSAFERIGGNNMVRYVRGVVASNISDLTAFTVASNDGITYVAGDRVLLAAQSTAAQCGIYVVGTVAAGSAPLTRAADMPAGYALPLGSIIEVGPEGTVFKNSTWKATATTTGGAVIGTNDPAFYPRNFRKTVTLSAGTYTIGAGGGSEPLFLLSTTASTVHATRDTVGGTVTTTIMYVAPVASRIAGKAGTAAVEVRSAVAAGTILNTDTSTVSVTIANW